MREHSDKVPRIIQHILARRIFVCQINFDKNYDSTKDVYLKRPNNDDLSSIRQSDLRRTIALLRKTLAER